VLGDVLLFGADEGQGQEMWRTDGTMAGTYGLGTGYGPVGHAELAGTTYFRPHPALSDSLWTTDGTMAGTQLVYTFGGVDNSGNAIVALTDGLLMRSGAVSQQPLWASNGTAAGTTHLAISLNLLESSAGMMAALDGVGYLLASQAGVPGLWRSDGTVPGTSLVAPIGSTNVTDLFVLGGQLLFFVRVEGSGEIWTSDGTPGGTAALAIAFTEIGSAYPAIGGYVYFQANDGATGVEMWRTDGTVAGTSLVVDGGPDIMSLPHNAVAGTTHAYFTRGASAGGPYTYSLWRCSAPL
jgi:ELWxxDGT repeat protein